MQLVDEQHDVLDATHLGHDRLDALLELTAVLGARDHQRQVEDDDAAVAQQVGHLVGDDLLGQALDDRGLADPRLAQQDRVVLGAAREDLDHALDLAGATDDRVQLAFLGELGQVAAEGVEGRRLALRARAADRVLGGGLLLVLGGVLGAEELEHLLADLLELDVEVGEHLGGDALVLLDQAQQQVLRPDVVVAEVRGLLHGELEHLLGARA